MFLNKPLGLLVSNIHTRPHAGVATRMFAGVAIFWSRVASELRAATYSREEVARIVLQAHRRARSAGQARWRGKITERQVSSGLLFPSFYLTARLHPPIGALAKPPRAERHAETFARCRLDQVRILDVMAFLNVDLDRRNKRS